MNSSYPTPHERSSEDLSRYFTLFKTQEKFYIQPNGQDGALIIDRLSHDITSRDTFSSADLPSTSTKIIIYGVIGIIRLVSCPYLLVITKATKICFLQIYQVDEVEVLPFSTSELHMNEEQINLNQRYLSMLNSFLSTKNFYFSFNYDITNSYQRQYLRGKLDIKMSIPMDESYYESVLFNRHQIRNYYDGADKRFVWNNHALSQLVNVKNFYHYCPLMMLGAIFQRYAVINQKKFALILISRRSIKNAGTRFNCRGVDLDGNVSNFVETEHILIFNARVASIIQVRGSIPLLWKQTPDLRYKPIPEIDSIQDHVVSMHKHIDELSQKYGKLSIVNLVDHKGFEGKLEQLFSDKIRYLSTNYYPILYHSFDFHKECSNMRWHRLKLLMDQIKDEIRYYRYCSNINDFDPEFLTKDNIRVPLFLQEGVIRTNCIDSLDRTNVVQSMISRLVLEQQLRRFNILPVNKELEDYGQFISDFQDIWASNADLLSIQYAGTPALKTDFTRTGKRTLLGMLMDGVSSLTRYFKNNFSDGYRQDTYDLFLGNYTVSPTEGFGGRSPLQEAKNFKQIALPSLLLFTISLLLFSLLGTTESNPIQVLFFIGLVCVSLVMIFRNGSELVDTPKLKQPTSQYNPRDL